MVRIQRQQFYPSRELKLDFAEFHQLSYGKESLFHQSHFIWHVILYNHPQICKAV